MAELQSCELVLHAATIVTAALLMKAAGPDGIINRVLYVAAA